MTNRLAIWFSKDHFLCHVLTLFEGILKIILSFSFIRFLLGEIIFYGWKKPRLNRSRDETANLAAATSRNPKVLHLPNLVFQFRVGHQRMPFAVASAILCGPLAAGRHVGLEQERQRLDVPGSCHFDVCLFLAPPHIFLEAPMQYSITQYYLHGIDCFGRRSRIR